LEIIGKLATVLEVEPAELLRVPAPKGKREPLPLRIEFWKSGAQ